MYKYLLRLKHKIFPKPEPELARKAAIANNSLAEMLESREDVTILTAMRQNSQTIAKSWGYRIDLVSPLETYFEEHFKIVYPQAYNRIIKNEISNTE